MLTKAFNYPFQKKQKKKNKTYQQKETEQNGWVPTKKRKKKMKKQIIQRKKEGVKASEIVTAIAAWYFRFKFFFFFFLTGRFSFSGRNTPIFGRYDPIRPKSARIGSRWRVSWNNNKKKLDVVRCAGSGVPHVSPPRTRVRWPICRVYASQLQCKIYIWIV